MTKPEKQAREAIDKLLQVADVQGGANVAGGRMPGATGWEVCGSCPTVIVAIQGMNLDAQNVFPPNLQRVLHQVIERI